MNTLLEQQLIEHVTQAIFEAMDITDGLDIEAAETYARAAITAIRALEERRRVYALLTQEFGP